MLPPLCLHWLALPLHALLPLPLGAHAVLCRFSHLSLLLASSGSFSTAAAVWAFSASACAEDRPSRVDRVFL
eukprot:2418215-Alexandrium_andersonii.AAC.1